MQNEFVHLEDVAILFSEMSELECTHRGCTEGPGGGKFKTPALPPEVAFAILKMHQENCHRQEIPGPVGGDSKVQLAKIPRPAISGGCSQEDFQCFKRNWARYPHLAKALTLLVEARIQLGFRYASIITEFVGF